MWKGCFKKGSVYIQILTSPVRVIYVSDNIHSVFFAALRDIYFSLRRQVHHVIRCRESAFSGFMIVDLRAGNCVSDWVV